MRTWTTEERAKQRAVINRVKPWQKSTGPRTALGKLISKANSYKHGMRSAEYLEVKDALRSQEKNLAEVQSLESLVTLEVVGAKK